jgi:methyl-accepting chemotaxis protein/methyl-accepting chemotaxis protein-1 (serine sensor receptor)
LTRKKIAFQIWLLVGLTWGVGTGVACFLMYRLQDVSANYDSVLDRQVRMQDSARQMQVRFKVQVQEWKDILLRGFDPEALKKYSEAFHKEEKAVRGMAEALKGEVPDAQTRSLAEEFVQAHAVMGIKYASALQAFTAAKGLNSRDADKMVKGQDRAPTVLVDKIVALLRERASAERASQKRALAAQSWAVAMVLLLCFGGIGAGSVLTIRGLSGTLRLTTSELRDAAEQVATAAAEVSSSSQSLAQGCSEQAASLEENSTSSEEIDSMAGRNCENSRSAASLMTQSQQHFTQAMQALGGMVATMGEIDAQSGKISKIVKVIDEIAFQTNILALNAAVEAARAGEAGTSFAVVADEVRRLAQRSAQAARDTASLIEESIVKSHDGKAQMDQVAAALQAITEESAKVKTLVDEVNLGSQKQARGIAQVGKAILHMEQITQRTAATAEESAAAAEELSAQSQTLNVVIEQLTAMVDGAGMRRVVLPYRG